MMGVPSTDRPHVRKLAEKLLNIGRGEHDRMKPLTEGMQGMIDYVSPLVDERLVNPGDDFISVLASGEKKGVFTRHQVLVNTSLLLLAGHETTINLLCNGTLALIRHPEQWALLKTEPEGLAPRATEECLRYDAPVKSIQRIATQDVEMRGKVLRKDDRIRWFISAANRDPEAFAQPERFDITRDPNPHVAFGRVSTTAWEQPWPESKGRRCSRRWRSGFRRCTSRRRRSSTSRASPSARSSRCRWPGARAKSWLAPCACGWITTGVWATPCARRSPRPCFASMPTAVGSGRPRRRHGRKGAGGGGELSRQRHLRGGRPDGRPPVSVVCPGGDVTR